MKIAVTSKGRSLDSEIDQRFGRAAHFVVVEAGSWECEAFDNTSAMNAARGAGVQAAEAVSRLGAEVVITGHCGPKAFQALKAAGIRIVVGANGTVKEAVEGFGRGDLKPADSSDVEGHWG